jgi:outer membrane protein OmpA-like peptidoglycan-associated protein
MKEGPTFASGSAALAEETESEIDNFLGGLEKSDDLVFVVAGHTDSVGAEGRNYELGQRRAASVARYLTTRKGIDPLQVTTMSYGESAPVADNSTAIGRRENRRVELLVYRQAISSSPGEKAPRVSQAQ